MPATASSGAGSLRSEATSGPLNVALARAEVARLARRTEEERAALADALAIAEAKGHAVAVERIREQLEG